MSCNKKCDSCNPEPCKCHPCYDVKVGMTNDCKEVSAPPVDPCDLVQPCNEGCENYTPIECVITGDPEVTLLDIIENLQIQITSIQNQIDSCCGENTCIDDPIITDFEYNCGSDTITFNSSNTDNVVLSFTGDQQVNLIIENNDVISLPSGTYVLTGYSNQGCSPFSTPILIDCNCKDIVDPSFSYDCDTRKITVTGGNVLGVNIIGFETDLRNGDILGEDLLNQDYNIEFINMNESCETVNITYNPNCV